MAATSQNQSDHFVSKCVSKRPVYNMKESFEEQSPDLLFDLQAFILGNISWKSLLKDFVLFYIFYVNMFYPILLIDLDIPEG